MFALETIQQIRAGFSKKELWAMEDECDETSGHCTHKYIGENSTWVYELNFCCCCTKTDVTILNDISHAVQEQQEIWANY